MRKLPRLGIAPASGGPGKHAPLPALGNELIEQDKHPAQAEQRQVSGQPARECRVAAFRNRLRCGGSRVLPGCSRISAVSFTGSSQPKYSKSTNANEPLLRRKLL